jgi:hypothetical protein
MNSRIQNDEPAQSVPVDAITMNRNPDQVNQINSLLFHSSGEKSTTAA